MKPPFGDSSNDAFVPPGPGLLTIPSWQDITNLQSMIEVLNLRINALEDQVATLSKAFGEHRHGYRWEMTDLNGRAPIAREKFVPDYDSEGTY